MKVTKRAQRRFEYFSQCEDVNRLPKIQKDEEGLSAAECFYMHETHGKLPPCREPEMLSRALNGKERHGVTVTNCAQDYVDRIFFASDLKEYPEWVQKDILGRASQLAMEQIGFVPTFVKTGKDFSTIKTPA